MSCNRHFDLVDPDAVIRHAERERPVVDLVVNVRNRIILIRADGSEVFFHVKCKSTFVENDIIQCDRCAAHRIIAFIYCFRLDIFLCRVSIRPDLHRQDLAVTSDDFARFEKPVIEQFRTRSDQFIELVEFLLISCRSGFSYVMCILVQDRTDLRGRIRRSQDIVADLDSAKPVRRFLILGRIYRAVHHDAFGLIDLNRA